MAEAERGSFGSELEGHQLVLEDCLQVGALDLEIVDKDVSWKADQTFDDDAVVVH